MTVFGASVNQPAKYNRVSFIPDDRFDNLAQGNIIPLIGYIIAKTDVAPLQLIIHLLLKANPVFGQPPAVINGYLAHIIYLKDDLQQFIPAKKNEQTQ
jgi:hypothetical protein